MIKTGRISLLVLAMTIVVAASAIAKEDVIRYEARWERSRGYLDFSIDIDKETCEGRHIQITRVDGSVVDRNLEFSKCVIRKKSVDDRGNVTALSFQYDLSGEINNVYYGWISVNTPGMEKRIISGYYSTKGTRRQYPWYAVAMNIED